MGPHGRMLVASIQRHMDRPAETVAVPGTVNAPPGAPIGDPALDWFSGLGIGQPAMDWLGVTEPWCTHEGGWH